MPVPRTVQKTKKSADSLPVLKQLTPRVADVKYTGIEPEWHVQPDDTNRLSRVTSAFTWYNYHYGKKEVKLFLIDWLTHHNRTSDAKLFDRVAENTIVNSHGWIARMSLMGLQLNEHEELALNNSISRHLASTKAIEETKKVKAPDENSASKPNIQDRLREKVIECASEIDGMFDEFIKTDAKSLANFKPISVMRGMNISPTMVSIISEAWVRQMEEFTEALSGKDPQLVEGYSHVSKMQMKNWVKFAEQVIADCNSYVQVKKVERKPRVKKAISPEKQVLKFKYLREFAELNLKSEHPSKLVGSSEAWIYDTAKRKLIHVVADSHSGTFTVKGSSIIGFDATTSTQKTLRKPAEQLKELLSANAAGARKFYKDIKSVDIKFNGRSNENLVLLKIK